MLMKKTLLAGLLAIVALCLFTPAGAAINTILQLSLPGKIADPAPATLNERPYQ